MMKYINLTQFKFIILCRFVVTRHYVSKKKFDIWNSKFTFFFILRKKNKKNKKIIIFLLFISIYGFSLSIVESLSLKVTLVHHLSFLDRLQGH